MTKVVDLTTAENQAALVNVLSVYPKRDELIAKVLVAAKAGTSLTLEDEEQEALVNVLEQYPKRDEVIASILAVAETAGAPAAAPAAGGGNQP